MSIWSASLQLMESLHWVGTNTCWLLQGHWALSLNCQYVCIYTQGMSHTICFQVILCFIYAYFASQLYFLKGRVCVLKSICLHQHWAKSGLYSRCLKMLLRWVLVKHFFRKSALKNKTKQKTPSFCRFCRICLS